MHLTQMENIVFVYYLHSVLRVVSFHAQVFEKSKFTLLGLGALLRHTNWCALKILVKKTFWQQSTS